MGGGCPGTQRHAQRSQPPITGEPNCSHYFAWFGITRLTGRPGRACKASCVKQGKEQVPIHIFEGKRTMIGQSIKRMTRQEGIWDLLKDCPNDAVSKRADVVHALNAFFFSQPKCFCKPNGIRNILSSSPQTILLSTASLYRKNGSCLLYTSPSPRD